MRMPLVEPNYGDLIRLLDYAGDLSDRYSRVKSILSFDPHEDLWEVVDTLSQRRIIAASTHREWLEIKWDGNS